MGKLKLAFVPSNRFFGTPYDLTIEGKNIGPDVQSAKRLLDEAFNHIDNPIGTFVLTEEAS